MPPRPSIVAPASPQQGVRLFTLPMREYGSDCDPCSNLWVFGDCFRIDRVNGRSFYWRAAKARAGRRLLVEWHQWLSELQRTRHVWLLEPEPHATGWQLLRPLQPGPMAGPAMVTDALDRFERDQRFQRAVHQVLEDYELERSQPADGLVLVTVAGGTRPYEVQVSADWSQPPACSCPDAVHRRPVHGGFCKHAVAVLLRWPDLRCQLLTAIL